MGCCRAECEVHDADPLGQSLWRCHQLPPFPPFLSSLPRFPSLPSLSRPSASPDRTRVTHPTPQVALSLLLFSPSPPPLTFHLLPSRSLSQALTYSLAHTPAGSDPLPLSLSVLYFASGTELVLCAAAAVSSVLSSVFLLHSPASR
eukprot:3724647-Rhodomonas_salina.1